MPDYGHDLRFGVFIIPTAAQAQDVVATAVEAEVRGLDSVSIQDHPYQPAFLDALTLLTHIGARTERVTLFPNVANLPLRPPAVLARIAASIDVLTDGRFELGLGAGNFWDAIEAMGEPRKSPGEAVTALEEGIAVIRALWGEGRAPRIDGQHYRLAGARPGPAAPHRIGIWLGALKPRMLRLTGRLADGWSVSEGYVPADQLAAMNATIDEAAEGAGREPADVVRIYNISPMPNTVAWVEHLAELALDEGMSHFVVPAEPGSTDFVRFAEEVAPAVRELVEAERLMPAEPPATTESPAVDRPERETVAAAAHRPAAEESGDGARLVLIHDHLRTELDQLTDLVEQVATGHVDVGTARTAINEMTLRQNNWTLGTYCESYCRVVTTHHTIEDNAVFPRLRAEEPGLNLTIDRLEREHREIHEVLENLDRALVGLVGGGTVDEVRAAVDGVSRALLPHLSYEEDELVEPLNRIGFGAGF